jgi:hypothetical protein
MREMLKVFVADVSKRFIRLVTMESPDMYVHFNARISNIKLWIFPFLAHNDEVIK